MMVNKHTINLFGKPATAISAASIRPENELSTENFCEENVPDDIQDENMLEVSGELPSRMQRSNASVLFEDASVSQKQLTSPIPNLSSVNAVQPVDTISTKKAIVKPKKIAHSFHRTKSVKEKLQEKKIDWEREKFEKQQNLQLKMMNMSEANKKKRHEEKKEIMLKYLEEKKQ